MIHAWNNPWRDSQDPLWMNQESSDATIQPCDLTTIFVISVYTTSIHTTHISTCEYSY